MAWESVVDGLQYARNAGADLSAKLFYIAKLDTDEDVNLATAASDKIIGVIREAALENAPVTVQFGGVGKVIAGGAIVAGDLITADGSGKGIATTSTGNRILGIALEAAATNEIFSCMLSPGSV